MATAIWPSAIEAADMVAPGTVVGLGTGRAAAMFVHALASRVKQGLDVRGVPTSVKTAELAKKLGVPLTTLDEVDAIDIDADGADEVDPELNLVKGHGGAHQRERVVASISKRFVVLVGEEKLVPHLGAKRSLPVEVAAFAVPVVRRSLKTMGARVELRKDGDDTFVSDNGNPILDADFGPIDDPAALEKKLDAVPGVVDHGLFVGMADLVLVHTPAGTQRMERH